MDLPTAYVATTESLLRTLSLSHELGHLIVGLVLYLGVRHLPGARRGALLPLLAVVLAEFGNEAVQAVHCGSWRPADTLADIAWTLLCPCLAFVYAQYRGRQVSRQSAAFGRHPLSA